MRPRSQQRVPVGYPANIQGDTCAGSGVLFDLSPTGCRMRSDIAMQQGTYLALQIAVPQQSVPVGVEVSVVRWSKDGHFGVEFLRYQQGDRERVTHFLEALPSHSVPIPPDHAEPTLTASGA